MEATPHNPLTTEELVKQLYELHDAELFAIFSKMLENVDEQGDDTQHN